MKIILFSAASINGFIADKKGSEDFLADTNWQSFKKLAEKYGCLIIGRKAFEIIQKWPGYNYDSVRAKVKIIVSAKKNLKLKPPYYLASSPQAAIKIAKAHKIKVAILAGGSRVNQSFLIKNLIDELVLNFEPAILGDGIPVIAPADIIKGLKLIAIKKITKNLIQLRYKVNK